MKVEDLLSHIPIENIDFRIMSINKGGYATLLAYKDARVDMNRLDTIVGSLFWKREHFLVGSSMYCKVSIYNKELKEWISKEDVGVESFAEKEKGLASDSFKRACTNWGIGRELYDYPPIQIKLNNNEFYMDGKKAKPNMYNLNLKSWKWAAVFKDNVIVALGAQDNKGITRFKWAKKK